MFPDPAVSNSLTWELVRNAHFKGPGGSWEELDTLHRCSKRAPPSALSFPRRKLLSYFQDEEPVSCSPLAPSEIGKEKLSHRLPHINVTPRGLWVLVRGMLALPVALTVPFRQQRGDAPFKDCGCSCLVGSRCIRFLWLL